MARDYRALISVPIAADDDEDARRMGAEYAHSLVAPGDGKVVVGHLEFIGELRDDSMEIARVVLVDSAFRRQLPPDWKP